MGCVLVGPQVHLFNPNTQRDARRRWGLWQVRGHAGAAMNGVGALIKEAAESALVPVSHMRAQHRMASMNMDPRQAPNLPAP